MSLYLQRELNVLNSRDQWTLRVLGAEHASFVADVRKL